MLSTRDASYNCVYSRVLALGGGGGGGDFDMLKLLCELFFVFFYPSSEGEVEGERSSKLVVEELALPTCNIANAMVSTCCIEYPNQFFMESLHATQAVLGFI